MEEFAVIIDSSCSRQLMIDQEHIFNSCVNHVLINHVHAINYGQWAVQNLFQDYS